MAAVAVPYSIDCAGNLHTSVVEILLRGGAGGVLILACPERNCWNREGPRWLGERVYHGREAELQPRVERARVRIVRLDSRERGRAVEVASLGPRAEIEASEGEDRCEPALVGKRS
jgi:coenzyme F420-reducing hydrogenase delta subunit